MMNVTFMGRTISVEFNAELPPDFFGYSSEDGRTVKISAGLDPADVLDTLLHELCHSFFTVMGVDDECMNEEQLVHFTSTCWASVMIENPNLLSCVRQLSEDARKKIKSVTE